MDNQIVMFKKIYTPYILAILLSIHSISLFAAESKWEDRGNKSYAEFNYKKAIEYYEHSDLLSFGAQRNLAECYRLTNELLKSQSLYEKLVINASATPKDIFIYAQVLKMQGFYDESDVWMKKLAEISKEDLRGKSYDNFKDYATVLKSNPDRYKIKTTSINSEQEDFSPIYWNDRLVFASSRKKVKLVSRKWNGTKLPFIDLYQAKIEKGKVNEDVTPFPSFFNDKFHDGPASFTMDGKTMIFTRNNYDSKSDDGTKKLQMFISRSTDGKWSKPEGFKFNSPEYSTGHPAVNAKGDTIYFVSDMPGSIGGTDIYMINYVKDSAWTAPKNMGNEINTEGNEMFPFYHPNGQLYFASNGHVGLGGLDVFSVSLLNGSAKGEVTNLGFPLNNQFDDFGLILDSSETKGFFSSNRQGGLGFDDIYAFEVLIPPVPEIITKVIAGYTKTPEDSLIPNCLVQLFSIDSLVLDSIRSDSTGMYSFVVDPDSSFKLLGSKQNFIPGSNIASTKTEEDTVWADLVLKELKVGDDLAKVLKINPIYFDYDKSFIRPDAAIELDKIVKIMNEYPSMEIELGSHTDCRGSKNYNRRLSDRRAKSSAKYIREKITTPERIYGKGYGEEKLVNDCACEGRVKSTCSDEQHQANRRTEFVIIKM